MNTSSKVCVDKATIYLMGAMGMGYSKLEVRNVELSRRKYAQYASAVVCEFVKKGARKRLQMVQSHAPNLVVLEGWGHPDTPDKFEAPVLAESGCTVRRMRHSGFSPEWAKEFNEFLTTYLASSNAVVVADYRGVSTYEPLPEALPSGSAA